MSNPNAVPDKVFIGLNGEAEKQLLDYIHTHADFNSENLPQSTLDNPVHPIFHRSRWTNEEFSEDLYEIIKPALQLASLFLTDDRMNSWWLDFETSQPQQLPGGREYLSPNVDMSQVTKRKAWEKKLNQLSKVVTWEFSDLLDDNTDAITSPFSEERDDFIAHFDRHDRLVRQELAKRYDFNRTEVLKSEEYNLYTIDGRRFTSTGLGSTSPSVMLARKYLTYLKLASTVDHVKPSFLFVLAIILCHELAHCTWTYPRPTAEYPDEFVHLIWNRNIAASLLNASLSGDAVEVGKEWEKFMFGQCLDFVRFPQVTEKKRPAKEQYSLVGYHKSGPDGTSHLKHQNVFYILGQFHRRYETTLIPLHNIGQLFQKTT